MTYNEELESEVMEEYVDDSTVLPVLHVQGKIVGRIERHGA